MIVVDANVIIYRYIQGPFSALAHTLIQKDPDWRTASLWRYEFSKAIVTMVRNKLLSADDAHTALSVADSELTARESQVPQSQVMQAALRHGISGYDAQYVALAQILRLRCVSADARLVRKTPNICMLLADFVKQQS
jgi:predicted nucleic acid-binding protein